LAVRRGWAKLVVLVSALLVYICLWSIELRVQDRFFVTLAIAMVLTWLIGPMDPIYPYVGFTLYGMVMGLMKYSHGEVRQRGSSPKLQVLNTALVSAQSGVRLGEARADRETWGRLVESADLWA
jgi:hypothetical protein